jgi:hypothetical protein
LPPNEKTHTRAMGFLGWYWRHSSFRPVKQPRPKAAMSTIAGVTHRLRWVDRNAGWRMACSCGWVDHSRRWTQDNAVRAGNQHIRSMQWAEVRGKPLTPARFDSSWYVHPSRQPPFEGGDVVIACFNCKSQLLTPGSESSYECPRCGSAYALRMCPGCSIVVHVPRQVVGGRVQCFTCRANMGWRKWDARPVTCAQYSQRVVLPPANYYYNAVPPPFVTEAEDRRERYEDSKALLLANDPELAAAERARVEKASARRRQRPSE